MTSYTYFLNTSNCVVVLYLSGQAASECINRVNGAFFDNGTHDCALLLDKTDSSGVYVNRASICADTKTMCCTSCKQVQKVNHIDDINVRCHNYPKSTILTVTRLATHERIQRGTWIWTHPHSRNHMWL